MHKRIKTKKVKASEECNKKELKNDNNNNNNNSINDNNNNNDNDYNDSNRKEKALKVATKKTLKIKKSFFPDF